MKFEDFKSRVEKTLSRSLDRVNDAKNTAYAAHLNTHHGELRVEIRKGEWFIRMRFQNLDTNPPLHGITGSGLWDIGTGQDGPELAEAHLNVLVRRLEDVNRAPVSKFDTTKLHIAADDAGEAVYLVTAPGEAHPIAEIDCNVNEPGEVANRIAACVNAAIGLSLPDDVKPGAMATMIDTLARMTPYGDGPTDLEPNAANGEDAMRVLSHWILKAREIRDGKPAEDNPAPVSGEEC